MKQKKIVKIKPCPFCGYKEILIEKSILGKFCYCMGCLTGGPTGKDKDDAVEKWNKAKR